MIDIENAKIQFSRYLDSYDRSDDKIRLKMVHTNCVLGAADRLCREEGFTKEDHNLALLIALLHDIGRFEQIKAFNSFNDRLLNHASFGVRILFEDRMIEQFAADRQFDEVIRKAIQYHSAFSLSDVDGLSERELLHCQIIRDADKLDNFRVKETERLETLFDVSKKEVEAERISPAIMEAF